MTQTPRRAPQTQWTHYSATPVNELGVSPLNPDESLTLAVVVSEMKNLKDTLDRDRDERRDDFSKLRDELRQFHNDKVSEAVWLQRNEYSDSKFQKLEKDLVAVKQDVVRIEEKLESRRAPWTAILGGISGVVAVAITLILNLTPGG